MNEHGPSRWPDNHRHVLVTTIDFEDVQFLLANDADGNRRDKSMSVFEYGNVRGVDALLAVLESNDTSATWFVPGVVAERHSELIAEIAAAGHEIATSGYALERFDRLTETERRTALQRAVAAIGDACGSPPVGFRLPVGEWPDGFAVMLADVGFTWSSSLGGDDLPYTVPAGDGRALVELPRMPVMNDRVAFFWNFSPPFPAGQSRIASYEGTLDNWRWELAGAAEERSTVVITLHPEICGTPARRAIVASLLADDVAGTAWRPRGADLAMWWAARHSNGPDHPVEVLLRGSNREAL